ncbi:DUF1659 domain-containing protein [Paraclostridium sordellii]|uniref:DUF1659 domain-containing protein n=1 Tax=Paraclostridium sordellii TaxID=1505 RepID=UPI0003855D79|nr:DUF1659 domain-containing protein [Paeniclostridium sordellii]EPZ62017.1 hypothetical protein H476_3506 [[Clostridium] sordellii VPI 9048] [Paeniclostridium sordellii VPI 9048]
MPDNRVSTEVSETKNCSTLKIKYDCGLNGEGKTMVKSRSYSNVKANAKALDVFNVAEKKNLKKRKNKNCYGINSSKKYI